MDTRKAGWKVCIAATTASSYNGELAKIMQALGLSCTKKIPEVNMLQLARIVTEK